MFILSELTMSNNGVRKVTQLRVRKHFLRKHYILLKGVTIGNMIQLII